MEELEESEDKVEAPFILPDIQDDEDESSMPYPPALLEQSMTERQVSDTEGDYQCRRNLNYHERIHLAMESYVTQHKKTTPSENKPFRCDVCSKTFMKSKSLSKHMEVHPDETCPHLCDYCGKRYKTKKDLSIHSLIHQYENEPRPMFQCEYCPKSFSQRSNLVPHVRTVHWNERMFQCNLCNKSYKHKCSLEGHLRRAHTFESPFPCLVCGKAFKTSSAVAKHRKIHLKRVDIKDCPAELQHLLSQ